MSSYVITGANRGLGAEFLAQLSSDPNNIVVGLVRNKVAAQNALPAELKARSNVHLFQADIVDYPALKKAAEDTANVTGGGLDYLIGNGAMISEWDQFDGIGTLGTNDPERLEKEMIDSFRINAVGNMHLINAFMPLILAGKQKKVAIISSGMADADLVAQYDVDTGSAYAVSKAALNLAVAKFSAEYRKDGVLVMAICPGVVNTRPDATPSQKEVEAMGTMFSKFQKYAPNFTGPASPEYAAKSVLGVLYKSSVEAGNGGAFLSHLGTKRWL